MFAASRATHVFFFRASASLMNPPAHHGRDLQHLAALSLAALGVVFGDIGTSPLYAMRECFHREHGVEATAANVYGILSLIVWALIIVISVKYLVFILRADNRGEGGILALSVLVSRVRPSYFLCVIGLFGAALLYSDGMITPAITVLGAVEGLEIAAPSLGPFVQPLSVAILVAVFLVQKSGTARIGSVFGPVTLVWFLVIAALGFAEVVRAPGILAALNPYYAIAFLLHDLSTGFAILGTVFLVVTGGEALYADIGHFGVRPIRLVWFAIVLPALLLNYFGQGAIVLRDGSAVANPFFALSPSWLLYPLIAVATAAAVIASQALISGAFSLTMQAVQLGYSPRLEIRHTSAQAIGQIYLPLVNWALMLACIGLVLGFHTSSNLAAAYGVSITSTMLITTILFYVVARWQWHWAPWIAVTLASIFALIDTIFFAANVTKIRHGGWFPLAVAALIFVLMRIWQRGRALLAERMAEEAMPLSVLIESIREHPPLRVHGTAIFMAGNPTGTPLALLHNLKHNKVLHERVIILHVRIDQVPHVALADRLSVDCLDLGLWRMTLRFGFMDKPDVAAELQRICCAELQCDPATSTFFLGRETVITSAKAKRRQLIRDRIFAWMSQNARPATSFFSLPPNSVVEFGSQVKL
jgi:KUP system potassium uptake protein